MSRKRARGALISLFCILLWVAYATIELRPKRPLPKTDASLAPLVAQYKTTYVVTPLSRPLCPEGDGLARGADASQ
jgi:hypothetical protein